MSREQSYEVQPGLHEQAPLRTLQLLVLFWVQLQEYEQFSPNLKAGQTGKKCDTHQVFFYH